jgi:FkbM family methyltransferase
MRLNTRRLFIRLLAEMGITAVCDVGSMNGDDALAFRAAMPQASVFAFEANPENLRQMQANAHLRKQNIQVVPLAATDYDGEGQFFVVKADYSTVNGERGQSSLHRRYGELEAPDGVVVRTTRLDSFLGGQRLADPRIALWTDVEGKAYEALRGAAGVLHHVQLVHVEVETEPCVALEQVLYPEIHALLHAARFIELGTDGQRGWNQFNAVFMRRDLSTPVALRVSKCVAAARLRFIVADAMRHTAWVKRTLLRRRVATDRHEIG